jgi:hypothetical protein
MRVYWAIAGLAIWAMGCGYTLQNSKSPLFEKEGVSRIYVKPVINNSYKAGVENMVYNALMRSLSASRRVVLVHDPEQSDAVLQGTVVTADAIPGPTAQSENLSKKATNRVDLSIPTGIPVTTEYTAALTVNFSLTRTKPSLKKRNNIWSANFDRRQPFPAANQLGPVGTTSALINDSQFDRALSELAQKMMVDVNESMLGMF